MEKSIEDFMNADGVLWREDRSRPGRKLAEKLEDKSDGIMADGWAMDPDELEEIGRTRNGAGIVLFRAPAPAKNLVAGTYFKNDTGEKAVWGRRVDEDELLRDVV